jgi:hypothetical protein
MGESCLRDVRVGEGLSQSQHATQPPGLAQMARIIADLTQVTKEAAKVRREGKELIEVEAERLQQGIHDLQRVHDALRQEGAQTALNKILNNTEEIKKRLEAQPKAGARTWSEVAAGRTADGPAATTRTQRQQAAETRKDREITVTILDQMERERTASRAQEQILEQVRAQEPKGTTEKAITLRRLPSKDYQIVMATEESKQILEKADDWLRAIAPSARVKRRTYTVWVHGVRVQAVDVSNQEEAIATIRKANERFHPELDMVRVAWSSRTLAAGKRFGSLIVETGSTETANRLISLGLVYKGEVKYCERFIKEARVI